jgi:hypothetical protein
MRAHYPQQQQRRRRCAAAWWLAVLLLWCCIGAGSPPEAAGATKEEAASGGGEKFGNHAAGMMHLHLITSTTTGAATEPEPEPDEVQVASDSTGAPPQLHDRTSQHDGGLFVIRDAATTCPRLCADRRPKKNRVNKAKKNKEDMESFDCLIVEPFDPFADPMYLLTSAGSVKTAAAIRAMQEHLRARHQRSDSGADGDEKDFGRALQELQRRNMREQRIVNEVHAGTVRHAVEHWLRTVLLSRLNLGTIEAGEVDCASTGTSSISAQNWLESVEIFGSLKLGCATRASDLDLAAFIHTTLPPTSLVRVAADCLKEASEPPQWLRSPDTVLEVLQSSKCPVLTFEFLVPRGSLETEINTGAVDNGFLTSVLGFEITTGEASDCHSDLVSISVDLTFNQTTSLKDTNFLRDSFFPGMAPEASGQKCSPSTLAPLTLPSTESTDYTIQQLLLWLKHWTKSAGINEPKTGTLNSFGWRLMLLAVLIEDGTLPCLREGFTSNGSAEHTLIGLNVWYKTNAGTKTVGVSGSLSAPTALEMITHFVDELALCCSAASSATSATQRVFQVLTTDQRCDFDMLWDAMTIQGGNLCNPVVDRAIEAEFPTGCSMEREEDCPTVKLLVVDVDGCLFDISPALLAKDLEGDTFFFNSKDSIPDTGIAPRVAALLEAAT